MTQRLDNAVETTQFSDTILSILQKHYQIINLAKRQSFAITFTQYLKEEFKYQNNNRYKEF